MSRWTELLKKLKQWNKTRVIVVLGIIGMVCILLSHIGSNTSTTADTESEIFSAQEYEAQLEERLLTILQQMDGVGDASVMVTVESGVEYQYVSEEKTSADETVNDSGQTTQNKTSAETEVVLVDNDTALIQKTLEPSVRGVVVVCSGGDSPEVKQQVTNAVTAAFHISSARVCVTKMTDTSLE